MSAGKITDPEKYCESFLWDWKFCLGEVLPGLIMPTDLDATFAIERNGQILILETKRPGVFIGRGQTLTFNSFVKAEFIRVLIVWGAPNNPYKLQWWGKEERKCDLEIFRRQIKKWFDWANNEKNGGA